jgi:hypothetical protein
VTIPLRKWLVFAADFISTFFKFTDEQPTTVLLSTMSTLPEGTKFSELSDHSYCMKNIFKLIATEILNLIGFLWNGLTMFIDQLLANNSNPGQTQYSWDATDMGILCWLSFYASSFLFMGWHSRASRSFSVAKGLKSYHVKDDSGQTQRFLIYIMNSSCLLGTTMDSVLVPICLSIFDRIYVFHEAFLRRDCFFCHVCTGKNKKEKWDRAK